jgi:hypothetical protein
MVDPIIIDGIKIFPDTSKIVRRNDIPMLGHPHKICPEIGQPAFSIIGRIAVDIRSPAIVFVAPIHQTSVGCAPYSTWASFLTSTGNHHPNISIRMTISISIYALGG